MLNRNWINRGICVATGTFLGSAAILPLISERTFGSGVRRGVVAAALVLIVFAIIGAFRPESRTGSEPASAEDETAGS